MQINIETEVLVRENISADEYIFLYSLFHGKDSGMTFNMAMCLNLEDLGYVKQMPDDSVVLRSKALNLFRIVNDLELSFLEFFNTFPIKVPSDNNGSRPLRPKSSEADSVKDIRKKYLAIIKDKPELHTHIIKVLDAELAMRTKSNSMKFMNGILPWIHQKMWEKYEYLLDEDNTTTERVTGI